VGEREDEEEVAAKLAEAAAASLDWVKDNGVTLDQGKTEAALFRQKEAAPTASIEVGTSDIPLNTKATRSLRAWLDSQLTLKEHRAIRLKRERRPWDDSAGSPDRWDSHPLTAVRS
jgi:hypothetical protein